MAPSGQELNRQLIAYFQDGSADELGEMLRGQLVLLQQMKTTAANQTGTPQPSFGWDFAGRPARLFCYGKL